MRNLDVIMVKAVRITAVLFFVSVVTFYGCGQSADELYSEGKKLIIDEESFNEGMELLIQFEKKYPKDDRTPEVMLALATGYQSRKQFTESIDMYTKLLKKFPDSDEAYKGMFLLGYMYYEAVHDEEKAKTVLNRFIEMYPDSELTVSAKVLVENIGLPVEEWSTVKKIGVVPEQ